MLNLIIDIGNSRTKVALFNFGELMLRFHTEEFRDTDIKYMKEDHPTLQAAIVSSTKEYPEALIAALNKQLDYVIYLDHTVPLPIENKYDTPETLGKDRIAAAVGANKVYPNQDILIIDAGTAITYDFVNAQNEYLGGFISPGLSMRYKALYEFTSNLPLLEPEMPKGYFEKNTTDAIKGGIQLGLEGELNRMIDLFTVNKSELKIILTGGDTNYFEKLLKNHKFAALEITLMGLNTILEFNYIRQNNG